jgi:chemotaxis protein MotB
MTILMIFFLAMYGYTYLAKAALIKSQRYKKPVTDFGLMVHGMQQKLGDQIRLENESDKVVVRLGEKILFPSGSAQLNKEAAQTLADLANSIKLVDGDVVVQGHTDNVPIAGGQFKSNWELSAARAFSVIEALKANGVEAQRLAAWGFGENRPIAGNDTAVNRAQNRRIEIIIFKKKGASV